MDMDKITSRTLDGGYVSFWADYANERIIFDTGLTIEFESDSLKIMVEHWKKDEDIEVT